MADCVALRGRHALKVRAQDETTVVAKVQGTSEFKHMVVSGDLRCEGECHAHDPVCHAHKVPPGTQLILTPAETNSVFFFMSGSNEIRLPDPSTLSLQAPLFYEIVGVGVRKLHIDAPLAPSSYVLGYSLMTGDEEGITIENVDTVRLYIRTIRDEKGGVGWRVTGTYQA